MTGDWTDIAIEQWKSEEIKLGPSATLQTISQAEKTLDFLFPEDFKKLYLKMDGFVDWDWTPNMFSIWPLERIVEEHKQEPNKNYIGFCDYLINCHQIGFVKGRIGVFILYGQTQFVAETFMETIHLINSDSEKIY